MESSIADFIERMKVPSKKLSLTELRHREETWRALWSWIPDDVKYLIYRIGSTVRLVRRDYKGSFGELGAIKFTPSEYELAVYEKHYSENDGKWYYETKVMRIPSGAVMMLEFVQERQLAEDVEKPEVMGLDEAEGVTLQNVASQ